MNIVTTTQNGRLATHAPQADPLAGLPGWIRYLIGAFPQQKPNAGTFAALEDAFAGIDPDVMMATVKRYAAANVFWPGIANLNAVLSAAMAEYNYEIMRAPLREERHRLTELAYQGYYDEREWLELHREYVTQYQGFQAADIRRRMQQFSGM